jgi:hypothetical protein
VKQTRIGQFAVDEVKRMLGESPDNKTRKAARTEVVILEAGQEQRIEGG